MVRIIIYLVRYKEYLNNGEVNWAARNRTVQEPGWDPGPMSGVI